MAQIIQTICDWCQVEEKQTTALPFRINDVEVDICDQHLIDLTLHDLLNSLASGEVGARATVKAPPRNRGEHTGPPCEHGCNGGRPYKSMKGLRQHFTREHPDEPSP
jgi:hypothetical protein